MKDSINDLILDNDMLVQLYQRSLVQIDASQRISMEIPAEKAAIKFLGHNNKHVMILVNYADHGFLPESNLTFLSKLLEACKLNIGDVAIVNTAAEPASTDDLIINLSPSKIISFGAMDNSQNFSSGSIKGVPILNAPMLEMLMKESPDTRALKSRLWSALKQMFDL